MVGKNPNEEVYRGKKAEYQCACGWHGERNDEYVRYIGTERHHECPVCGRDLIVPFDIG
jgi:predicted RNA-binding Zn-ribbon protein involved in translation (DUF1610 family)